MIRRTLAIALILTLSGPAFCDQLQLTGIVRDLKRGDKSGGHADFETAGAAGKFGHATNLVTFYLSDDRKPVFNPNRPNLDTIKSANSFQQWFRDVPNVNVSAPLTLTLSNGSNQPGGIYSYSSNAFWPIDGQFFGNQSLNHNFHFTFELHTTFTYTPGQYFTFIGDDDVWVYINGIRIIDLGGVHSAITGNVRLFDGKAFVEKNHHSTGGIVSSVSTTMAANLVTKWTNLGLGSTCPIKSGDRYIDLNLNSGAADTRAVFHANNSVTVYGAESLSSVVLKFEDGTQQRFDNLTVGNSGTFNGSGAYAEKEIVGCWVKAGTAEGGYGQYHTSSGATSINCTLDFFFAERHTTQANFRIDTSMLLQTVDPATISPLYD